MWDYRDRSQQNPVLAVEAACCCRGYAPNAVVDASPLSGILSALVKSTSDPKTVASIRRSLNQMGYGLSTNRRVAPGMQPHYWVYDRSTNCLVYSGGRTLGATLVEVADWMAG